MEIRYIEELIALIKDARVSELAVTENGSTVRLKQPLPPAPRPKAGRRGTAVTEETAKPEEGVQPADLVITAPMVGIFHSLDTIASTGVTVAKGQPVGAIESMKLMNDVVSDVSGVITEMLVEDDMPVEYGQVLFRVSPLEFEE